MSEQETEGRETAALLLRVEEWAAWFPLHQDPQMTQLQAVSGETGIQLYPNERLVDIDLVTTQQTRTVPMKDDDNKPINVRVKLCVFRATLARTVMGMLPEDKMPDTEQIPNKNSLIIPDGHQNRDVRRKNGS